MLSPGTAVGNIQPYFLSQAVPDLDPSKPLDQQPELAAITDQALAAADIFAQFIEGATTSLDIAIYDFRLLPGALTNRIVGATRDAAGRGVTVRLAYDKTQEAGDDATLKAFGDAGGDPAPTGTHLFIARAALPPSVQVRAIVEEAIDPGHQIMHQKYIVRDAGRGTGHRDGHRRAGGRGHPPDPGRLDGAVLAEDHAGAARPDHRRAGRGRNLRWPGDG
jgi:hypothetical protein